VYIWRICKQKHEPTAFSGDGGLYAPSRWMPQGFRVVYTAETLALATLELFAHTESSKIPLLYTPVRSQLQKCAIALAADGRSLCTKSPQSYTLKFIE
jgi:RES domain-containing protein